MKKRQDQVQPDMLGFIGSVWEVKAGQGKARLAVKRSGLSAPSALAF